MQEQQVRRASLYAYKSRQKDYGWAQANGRTMKSRLFIKVYIGDASIRAEPKRVEPSGWHRCIPSIVSSSEENCAACVTHEYRGLGWGVHHPLPWDHVSPWNAVHRATACWYESQVQLPKFFSSLRSSSVVCLLVGLLKETTFRSMLNNDMREVGLR